MKKNHFSGLLLLTSLNVQLLAQTTAPAAKPIKTGNEWHMPADVIPRAQKFADDLAKTLGLDAAASQQVFNAYLANTKAVDEIRMGSGSNKDKEVAMQANNVTFEAALKGILSPEQFANYISTETGKKGSQKKGRDSPKHK